MDKFQGRCILQNNWPASLKSVRVIKNKVSPGNFHSQEEPEETRKLNVIWDPGTLKGQEVKTEESEKSTDFVNNVSSNIGLLIITNGPY